MGSVSVQSWSIACMAVILLVSDALVSAVGLAVASKTTTKQKEEPMKAGSGEKKASTEKEPTQAEKKEL